MQAPTTMFSSSFAKFAAAYLSEISYARVPLDLNEPLQ